MSTQGLRVLILFGVLLAAAGGCAGVPSVPARNAPSGVIPASATEPLPDDAAEGGPRRTDDDSGFDLSDLDPENVGKQIKKALGYGPDEGKARTLLKEGEALFRQKQYAGAAGKFQAAAARWPDSPLEEDALFLLGESRFFSDQYPKAQDTYDNLLTKYDNSRYLDTVVKRLFAIGRYWEGLHEKNPHWPVVPNLTDSAQPRFDTFGNALKAYETIRMKDPIGPLADDSIMASANAYLGKGRFEDAAYYYDMLRNEYPKSEHQLQAHLLGIQAKLQVYQGPHYDVTPLEEADEVAEQTLMQFRGELGEERARVAETRDRIAEMKAERDWTVAQFYEKKKQFGAARYYYQSLIKEFPRTLAARRARARLQEIRDEPDVPPNRFQWLTGLFPSER